MRFHSFGRALIAIAALSLAAAPLLGCVTKQAYDQLTQENLELQRQNRTLAEQGAQLTDVAAGLGGEIRLKTHQLAQLEVERKELAQDFDDLITAGAIHMKLLADGLHLTMSDDVLFATGSANLKPTGRDR